MNFKRKNKNKNKKQQKNNRSYFIIAIIFLFSCAVSAKLFLLQYRDHGHYISLAAQQHNIQSEIEPKRGKILIQDGFEERESELFPIATNKDFGHVYAVPSLIKPEEIEELSERLYDILDADWVRRLYTPVVSEFGTTTLEESSGEEMAEIDFEDRIRLKRLEIIEGYKTVLSKENDPYEPLAKKVGEAELKKIEEIGHPGIDYEIKAYRYYPENNFASHIMGFVGYSGDEKSGRYGLEGFFEEELAGQFGSIKTERDAVGNWIIANNLDYTAPVDGNDIILTINRTIQYEACAKLEKEILRHGADGGTLIIMEPSTGAIMAMCSYPDFDPNNYRQVRSIKSFNNPAIFAQYEPGSVFKPLTLSAAIDQSKVSPSTVYQDEGCVIINSWKICNSDFETSGAHGTIDMNKVLELSLNTGAIFAMRQVGSDAFAEYIGRYGFGEKTGIELEGESAGDIRNLKQKSIKEVDAAVASFGQGVSVTPLQMVNSYAAIANGGILMKPFLVKSIIKKDGSKIETKPIQLRRVVSERTAALVSGMLVNVVEKGHSKKAALKGFYVAGKTGTAQVAAADKRGYSDATIHTFVGFFPANEPRFVILVKMDNPRGIKFAEGSVVPLAGAIEEFLVNYYKLEPERNTGQ